MEANSDIARGYFKGSKEALTRFWRKAEVELNSIGPPSKCIAEWKKVRYHFQDRYFIYVFVYFKVWADQKKYVRHKAAQNLKEKRCTGGGPNKEVKFSATEEAIYNLTAMKSSVEGVSAKLFGLNSPNSKTNDETPTPEETIFVDNHVSQPIEVEELVEELVEYIPSSTCPKIPILPKSDVGKEASKISYDALQDELKVQKELLETIKKMEANQKEQEQSRKRIYRALDKINDNQQKHFKTMETLKRHEIEELRRHNAFIENLRAKEVEYKLEKNRIEMELLQCNK